MTQRHDGISHAERIRLYAEEVVSGTIAACKWVRLACKRHLDDLERSLDPGYPYEFDAKAANKICKVAELMPHVKGEWAKRNRLISLEPWESFFLGVPFGWKRRNERSTRRFREIYAEIPRKNGKSILGGIIGNYMFVADGEYAAEVYSGATSQKQAWEVYGPARQMLMKSPDICEELGVEIGAKNMSRAADFSKFEPLIGNPGDGANVSCAIIDEYHEHISASQYDTMQTGTGARSQPMIAIITTAGFSLSGPCYEKHIEAKRVLEGVVPNDELFAIIYTIDEEDDWAAPASLIKANPNYGISVDAEFLLSQQRQALLNPQYQNRFKTKHLNVWCSARSAWMNLQQWQLAADNGLTADDLIGCECVFAVDLASKSDLCAYVKLFWKVLNGAVHYYAFCHCYFPEDEVVNAGSNSAPFAKWARQGLLTLTDGSTVDYDSIVSDVIIDAKKYNPKYVVYDPFNATHFSQLLMDQGLTMVEFIQRPQNFAVPMDDIVTAVKDGRFHHDGNDMLTWMIANTAVRPAKKGLYAPIKEKPENKIDGAVALMMAVGSASAAAPKEPEYKVLFV